MKRVIIYARMSTRDQNVDMQLISLRGFAHERNLQIVDAYIDYASGAKNDRANYLKVFDAVRKRKTVATTEWKVNWFARSNREIINTFEEFEALGIDSGIPAEKFLITAIAKFGGVLLV